MQCSAQCGIFKTYDDFFNDNVETEYSDAWASHAGGNFKLVLKDSNGNKTKHKLSNNDIWGYRIKGKIYRIDKKGQPYWLVERGNLNIYVAYNAKYFARQWELPNNQFSPKMSIGENGEMMSFSKKNLKRLIGGDPDWSQEVNECNYSLQSLFDLVLKYNS